MTKRNSAPWFNFCRENFSTGSGLCIAQEQPDSNGVIQLAPGTSLPPGVNDDSILSMAMVRLNDGVMDQEIHSGDLSPCLEELDSRLQQARLNAPEQPLAVLTRPNGPWQRSHAWMLGEYLAERDLLLIADLRGMEQPAPGEIIQSLHATGLSGSNLLLLISQPLDQESRCPIERSGTWLLHYTARANSEDSCTGTVAIEQV